MELIIGQANPSNSIFILGVEMEGKRRMRL
jgi:hypothetical protein